MVAAAALSAAAAAAAQAASASAAAALAAACVSGQSAVDGAASRCTGRHSRPGRRDSKPYSYGHSTTTNLRLSACDQGDENETDQGRFSRIANSLLTKGWSA